MSAGDAAPTGLEFDRVAGRYDQARPDYPAELFDELTGLAGLGPGSELLEVGAGTGKATLPLARRGYRITCLEPGQYMSAVAASKLGPGDSVRFVPVTFEDWEPGGRRYDLVYSATAWHWVDPAVRYRKAAAVLKPGGALATWDARHGFPPGYDPFFDEIQPAYEEIGMARGRSFAPLPPAQVPHDAGDIDASGLFGPAEVRRFVWATEYTADSYIELLSTFSSHLVADPAANELLFARIRELVGRRSSGAITRHWLAILHVARLRPPEPEPRRPSRSR